MNTMLRGRDFITLKGYTREDLETILRLAFDLKMKLAVREPHPLLPFRELGMLFCNPSTRTRISFETAMSHLGGHAQYYAPEHLQLIRMKESWVDTAQTMSRYLDGIVVRIARLPNVNLDYGEGHAILQTMADNASIPVISASDDVEHPCQTMADIMTMIEKFGTDYKKKKVAVVFSCKKVGISPGAAHSLIIGAGILGMKLTFAYPKGYDLDPAYINEGMRLADESGGSIEIVHDINEAVENADVIYAKDWRAIGKTIEEDLEMRKSLKGWYVRKEHFDVAAPKAIFMHSMPLERDQDVTSEVVDSPRSVIYDQAENRLHTQKAIMSLLMR